MTEAESFGLLSEVLSDVLERPVTATPGLRAKDVVGWDSFAQVEIILQIEERMKVRFTAGEVDDLPTVGALAALVRARAA